MGFLLRRLQKALTIFILFFLATTLLPLSAQAKTPLRRPISPDQPMWLIHIDTWNYPDPQKIIDLIPKDIRPFVVMNISLSISHDVATSKFKVAEYGYGIAKSWLRTCAQNQMWAMVQLASGGYAQFSDHDLSVYEEFYRDYPNLIGFNYAEQFWGFGDASDPLSPSWTDRIAHFADLLELNNQYGGYLVVSWCGNQWSPSINPIAMLKLNPDFAAASQKYTENFILCEKYTQQSYQSDMESICLGAYLSGFSGNYGIRYDDTGWTNPAGNNEDFTMATAGAVHLEHIMLTGETVIDGPELIWTQCFKETNRISTTDGYTKRNWTTFSQFDNVSVDIFRKILDGTVRIPSRKEVINRTKVVVLNDVNSGSSDDIYSTPQTLFEGLYRMDGDGNLVNNKTFFKKTGRYPTIPTVYQLSDADAQSFQVQVEKSKYSSRWPSIAGKVSELNNLFPSEYSGDIYAGRHENGWVTYNPYKTVKTANGNIPFKYNKCDSIGLSFSQYTAGVIKEYADSITIYLSNYDNVVDLGLKTDIIKIYGSSSEPTYSWTDRAKHKTSIVSKSWSDSVFTLTVQHNGSVDFKVNCSGAATNRLTSYTNASIKAPRKPALYMGPRQYEAECFDYKNINNIVTAGQYSGIRNYSGQGYLQFGTSSSASVRDTVTVLRSGLYSLETRYSVTGGDVSSIDLYVNNVKVVTPTFTRTTSESDWSYNKQIVEMNAGKNVIVFKARNSGTRNINFDNIVISQGSSSNVYNFSSDNASTVASTPPAQLIGIQSGSAGVVSYTDIYGVTSNCFKSYSAGNTNGTAVADLEMFPSSAINYTVSWKEYYTTAGGKKGILLRGSGDIVSCSYAEGMKQGYLFIAENNEDNTVTLKSYIAGDNGIADKTIFTASFKVMPDQPCWFRATAFNNKLTFECSSDSVNWEGGSATEFTDDQFESGSTQLVWGLDSGNFNWVMDNITYFTSSMSASRLKMDSFAYAQSSGPSTSQSFTVVGESLTEDMVIQAPEDYELSLNSTSGYASSLKLMPEGGTIASTLVYVRLKAGLAVGTYNDSIAISSAKVSNINIGLSGIVSPQSITKAYDFSGDIASKVAKTPPALYTSIGQGNSATAGVVSYTDANSVTSNMFRPFGGGQRNATGAVDLNLFSKQATDYSVTWKQCVGSANTDYKVGVLLRGDTAKFGSASTGYVQGIMQGYLCLAYTTSGRTEFRIYKSSDATSLSMMTNISISTLIPKVGQPVWYRASVSGISSVSLKLEYSTDNITWKTGSTATDANLPYTSGATQIVWGLGVGNVNFYMDNITFYGIGASSETSIELIVPETSLDGFDYIFNSGPSASQSITVSGNSLIDNVVVFAPENYEVSLDQNAGYASSVTLQSDSNLAPTIIYVRLKAGLDADTYEGDVTITSMGVLSKEVSLSGTVEYATSTNDLYVAKATVVSTRYYTLTGQKIQDISHLNGVFIVKKQLSNGTISISKILMKR